MDATTWAMIVAAIFGSNAALELIKGVFQTVKERRGDGVIDRRRLETRIDEMQTQLTSRDARVAHLEAANAGLMAEIVDLQAQVGVLTRLVDHLHPSRSAP